MTDPTLAKLRNLLLNEFTEEDLKILCASLEINYEKLPGTGTFGKTRALLDKVQSQDKLRNLQAKVRELRPAAYEAAGFTAITDTTTANAVVNTTKQTRVDSSSQFLIGRWLALALIILLCLVAGLALLLPKLQNASQTAQATANAVTQAAPTTNSAAPTETPPAIVEVTDAMDKGASVLTNTTDTAQSENQNASASVTPIAPTALPLSGSEPATGIVITVTATSTPAASTTPLSQTATTTNTHPATRAIRDLNDQLPKFYNGEVNLQAIQQYWSGEALRSVTAFGTVRLPKAMRVEPSQRSTLGSAYEYRREPTLIRETRDGAVVTSREFWRYSTNANSTQICETRDYVYNLLKIDGKYKVSQFNSRLVDSGC